MEVKCVGDYDLICPISLEGFSQTYLAEHRFLKKEVVVKLIKSLHSSSIDFLIKTFNSIDHPHLIKPLMCEKEEQYLFLVYEPYLDSKNRSLNLQDFLNAHEIFSEEIVFSLLSDIASALDYIKSHRIGFANLKPSNILLQNITRDALYVGLIDFVSFPEIRLQDLPTNLMEKFIPAWANRSAEAKEDLLGRYEISRAFMPPEIKHNGCDPYEMNAYAFGVLAYLLLTKSIPGPMMVLPSKLGLKLFNWDFLVTQCLQIKPTDRPKSLKGLMEEVQRKTFDSLKKEPIKVQEIVSEIQKATTIKVHELNSSQELKPVLKAQELIRPTFDPDPAQIFHTESMIAPYRPKEIEQLEVLPIQTDMVIIPEGEYTRGSNEGARDERPAHRVFLNSFAMDIHPVTNEQFVRFLEAMGGEKDSHNNDLVRLRESRIKRSGGKLIIESGYAKHPVVGVSWYGALGYAKWVGKRLPTEAEWEVASRSLKPDMIYPTGLNIERTHANFFSADTTPVMSYPPIEIGLFDMAGNVYEWCHDWYDYNFYESSLQEPTNPKGPAQGVYRVLRGGCWKSLKDDLRCSHRHRNNPGTVNKTYGFRCAADVE